MMAGGAWKFKSIASENFCTAGAGDRALALEEADEQKARYLREAASSSRNERPSGQHIKPPACNQVPFKHDFATARGT